MSAARDQGAAIAPGLAAAFAQPRAGKRAVLIPYITGGFPSREACRQLVATFVEAGADIVELGVPFSDPVADGPVVQRSTQAALAAGTTTDDVFELAAHATERAPVVLLAYVNSVLAYGPKRFFQRAAAAGVEGLVVPDLPVDENAALAAPAAAARVSLVPLAAPTTPDDRLALVAAAATSFVYCVAVTGVTGVRQTLGDDLAALIDRLRKHTSAPLAAGFGISTPGQAAEAAALADGVIVGSALIEAVARAHDLDEAMVTVHRLLTDMAEALTCQERASE